MRTIHRFEIPVGEQGSTYSLVARIDAHGLPNTAAGRSGIVHLASRIDPNVVEVWLQVATLDPESALHLAVTGTGDEIPEGGIHVGTTLAPLGHVWHLWRFPS